MRALVQRVSRASVTVDDKTIGQIDQGLLLLVGFGPGDGEQALRFCAEKCANLRIFADDARLLIDSLEAASVECVFLLFPDPWPKTRHHKRRFVSVENLDALARILRVGGCLKVATDHAGYCRWILAHFLAHAGFEWTARTPRDWRLRPPDWPGTRYEAKARRQGRTSTYLSFVRVTK